MSMAVIRRQMMREIQRRLADDKERALSLFGVRCICGAQATGWLSNGQPRCCATCAFHPLGCRCQFGDLPDTVNEPDRTGTFRRPKSQIENLKSQMPRPFGGTPNGAGGTPALPNPIQTK